MNKFIKCWVFIICLLFILLILFTDRVNAETLSNVRIYGIEYGQPSTLLTSGQGVDGPDLLTGTANYTGSTSQTLIRVYWSNVGDSMSNKDVYFTTSVIGNIMGGVSIRDNAGHHYPCENYATSRDGIINVICKEVGTLSNNGVSFQYLTYGGYNARVRTSIPYVTEHDDKYTALIYSSVINTHSDLQSIINAINSLKTQDTTNTQNIINNQNQNAQQQHNDAQQQYNFISNTTIDTNTTSNVNNIDVSDRDTKLAVTNFALIPLNFMQSIINSFSSSCSQVCIGNCQSGHINDWRFVFPCLDLESLVGSTVYAVIDSLFAFGMVFAFIRSVRKFFINALLLTTDASSEVGVFL